MDATTTTECRSCLTAAACLVTQSVWFSWCIFVALLSVGVPLAVAGWFKPLIVIPTTFVLGILIFRLVESRHDRRFLDDNFTAAMFLVALALISVVALTNLTHSGQHHATNRDPGVYLETGLSLADTGTLMIDGREGPFLEVDQLRDGGFGFAELNDGTGRLHPQFGHAMAVVIAAASWFGGVPAASRAPALLMALALMLWWYAIRAVADAGWATVGVAALSINIVVVHVSRDTFSEPLAFALLAGAVVLLTSTPRTARWIIAGWALGMSVSARVDMTVVILGATVLAAITLRRQTLRTLMFMVAIGGAAGLSYVDLALRSPEYLSDRWSALVPVFAAGFAVLLVAFAELIILRVYSSERNLRLRERALPMVQWAGVAAIAAAAIFAIFVRPSMGQQHSGFSGHIAGLQQRDGLPVDGTRTYGENAANWLVWYMGLPMITLATIGAAMAWRELLKGRGTKLLPVLALTGPLTLLYLQRPRITGDQIWAMRRFVPSAMPLILILGSFAAYRLAKLASRRFGSVGHRITWIALVALMVAPAAAVTWPLKSDRTMLWPTYRITDLCEALGPDSAALVSSSQLLGDHLIRTIARQCDIPTARGDISGIELGNLTSEWRSSGRDLVVIAYAGENVPDSTRISDFGMPQEMLEQAVGRRPAKIERGTRQISIWIPRLVAEP